MPAVPSTTHADSPYARPHPHLVGAQIIPTTAISPAGSSGWSQGTTVTVAPRLHRHRIWLFFRPQSRAVTRRDPPGLNTRGACGRGSGSPGLLLGPASRSEGLPSPPCCPQPRSDPPTTPSVTPPAPGASCWGPQRRGSPQGSHPAPASPAVSPFRGSSWSAPECPLLQVGCETQSHGPSPPRQDPAPWQQHHSQMPTQVKPQAGKFQHRNGFGSELADPQPPPPTLLCRLPSPTF